MLGRKEVKKQCKICGNDFYLWSNNAKTCSNTCRQENIRQNNNKNSKIWVKRHPEKRKEICHQYSIKNSKSLGIKAQEWRKNHPQNAIKSVQKWRKHNPDKRNAQAYAQYHIKIPPKQLCEICNKKKAVDRHHPNYKEKLKVIFLCAKCHRHLHLKKGVYKNG